MLMPPPATCYAGVGGAGTSLDGDCMPQPEATTTTAPTRELVVFVGETMGLHLSTIRPSYMGNFGIVERRRCSILAIADGEKKSGNRFPSNDDDGGGKHTDQEMEEEWLNAIQEIVDENEARRCYRLLLGVKASLCMHRSC